MIATLPRDILLPRRVEFPAWVRKIGDPLKMFGHGAFGKPFPQPMGGAGVAAPFVPSDVSGYLYDWNAADFDALADGTAIDAWTDDASALAFTGSLTLRPTKQTVTFNSKTFSVVRADGSNDRMAIASVPALAAMSIYIVAKSGDANSGYFINMGNASGTNAIIQGFVATKWEYYSSPRTQIATISTTNFQTVATTVGSSSTGQWDLFFHSAGEEWAGDCARIIIYNRVVTAGEDTNIKTYLSGLYGTA